MNTSIYSDKKSLATFAGDFLFSRSPFCRRRQNDTYRGISKRITLGDFLGTRGVVLYYTSIFAL